MPYNDKEMSVLVIDPDTEETVNVISLGFHIRWPDCNIISTTSGEEGLRLAETRSPQMIILDIDLPDVNGFEVIKRIRLFSSLPIIVVSERKHEMDIVNALEIGADDYVIKPFSTLDLLARARAILRRNYMYRSESEDLPPFVSADLVVDFSSRQVLCSGIPVRLTPIEYRILCQLVRNTPRVVSVQAMKRQVWGDVDYLEPSTIRKSVSQLRQKIINASRNGHTIVNERGLGYKFIGPRPVTKTTERMKVHN